MLIIQFINYVQIIEYCKHEMALRLSRIFTPWRFHVQLLEIVLNCARSFTGFKWCWWSCSYFYLDLEHVSKPTSFLACQDQGNPLLQQLIKVGICWPTIVYRNRQKRRIDNSEERSRFIWADWRRAGNNGKWRTLTCWDCCNLLIRSAACNLTNL